MALYRSNYKSTTGHYFAEPYITSGGDQSANLQAAANNAGPGSILELPAATMIIGNSTIQIPHGQIWIGQNRGFDGSGTYLITGATSGTLIQLLGSYSGIRRIGFAGPTSACTTIGVQMGDGTDSDGQSIEECFFAGLYNQVYTSDGNGYSIHKNRFDNAIKYQLRLRNTVHADHGDHFIFGNMFTNTQDTAIRQESAGGAKIVGNKILAGINSLYGYDLGVEDGADTGDLEFIGNSVENFKAACIRLGRTRPDGTMGTTGKFNNISIRSQLASSTGTSLIIGDGISQVSVPSDCLIQASGTRCVDITGGNDMCIAPSVTFFPTTNAAIRRSGGTNINVDISNIKNGYNNGTGNGKIFLLDDTRSGALWQLGHENDNLVRSVNIQNVTSSSTYTDIFEFQVNTYEAVEVDFFVSGIINGVGVTHGSYKWVFPRGSSGAVSTPIVISSNAGSNTLDVNLDVTDTSGVVKIQIKLHSGVGTSFAGRAKGKFTGRLLTLKENSSA